MPVNNVGIVYSRSQQVIRRIVKAHIGIVNGEPNRLLPQRLVDKMDEEAEFAYHLQTLHPFEAWVTIPIKIYDTFVSHQQIHDHLGLTGTPTVTDKCMVVDKTGLVIDVGCWDPWIDKHPHGRIIPNADAEKGGTFINGVYNKPQNLLIFAAPRREMMAV